MQNHSLGYSGYCWGNAFDYVSRAFFLPRFTPTIVWTSLIGHHFVEAYRTLQAEKYLHVAKSVGDFILRDLERIPFPHGICLSYIPGATIAVHNANLLGARLLAELYKETSHQCYLDLATEAVRYSTAAQLPNGGWYYGEEPKYHWIDNFHTGYNLESLSDFQANTGSHEFEQCLLNGLDLYVRRFFKEDGAPRYYWNRDYKFDIQSCSQAIYTLQLLDTQLRRPDLRIVAIKVADWTLANMQDPQGYFYLWKTKHLTNRTPTLHWGAATMLHAMSHLLSTMS
jgi:hypothetical protein